jgi:lysozyme
LVHNLLCNNNNFLNYSGVPHAYWMVGMINKHGLDLIKEFEGFYPKPYICPAGVPTIGYGTTYYPDGRKVTLKDPPISKEKAEEYLKDEVMEKSGLIVNFLNRNKILLSDNALSAVISFAYNVGIAPVISGGRTMNQALRSKNLDRIADAFLIYNKATVSVLGVPVKKEVKGLTRRRQAERELFLS